MSLTRRTLLKRTSLALTSFGLGQMGLSLLTRRHQRVLATPTARKLALLIGVNSYPDSVFGVSPQRGPALHGAVTDVDLIRELLIARFGFSPADILTLQDKQATREGIETGLQFHLLAQAKADDVVVFHFSGIGSYVQLQSTDGLWPSGINSDLQPVLVPIDGRVPKGDQTVINDVMLATVGMFLKALPTRRIVSILDFGYGASTSLIGNLRVRSRLSTPTGALAVRVFDQHQQLSQHQQSLDDLGLSPTAAQSWPGISITAANSHGIATEGPWGGFSAGLLTYTLTQRLWWDTPPLSVKKELGQIVGQVERFVGSQYRPAFRGVDTISYGQSTKKFNFLELSDGTTNADGVVLEVDADQKGGQLWMAGLPPLVLQHCLMSSYVRLVSPASALIRSAEIMPSHLWGQVRSRTGLMAKAKFYHPTNSSLPVASQQAITPGMFVHEVVRMIPQDIGLVVALGNELERIERVDATSSLSSVSSIKSTTTGEQQVDCVFDKVKMTDISILPFPTVAAENSSDPNSVFSPEKRTTMSQQLYGLFQPGRNLIPGTMSTIEEAVKTAIRRVTPQFNNLLAEKLLRLTTNQGSSCLSGRVTLETVAPSAQQIGQQYTSRSPRNVPEFLPITPQQQNDDRPTLFVGDQIQCRLQNYSDRPLYGMLINMDSRGIATVLHPLETANPDEGSALDTAIPPGTITTVPSPTTSFPWTVSNSLGLATVYVIMSCAPFSETITELSKLVPSVDTMHRPQTLSAPLPIVQSILRDLHNASQAHLARLGVDIPSDRYGLSVDCWATFSFIYNVATSVSLESNL